MIFPLGVCILIFPHLYISLNDLFIINLSSCSLEHTECDFSRGCAGITRALTAAIDLHYENTPVLSMSDA